MTHAPRGAAGFLLITLLTPGCSNDATGPDSEGAGDAPFVDFSEIALQAADSLANLDIYIGPCDGGCGRVTRHPATDVHPAPSPDGARIAFQSDRDGNWEIYLIDITQSDDPVRLTDDPAADTRPTWSPDGSRIAFASERGGDRDIYVMDVDGSAPETRLTDLGSSANDPAWSPDGSRIAFSTVDETGFRQIYAVSADGTVTEALTDAALPSHSPAWSPDGEMIAFSRQDAIWTMSSDGTNPILFAQVEETFLDHPNWSPDGTTIFFDLTAGPDETTEGIYSKTVGGGGSIVRFPVPLEIRRPAQPASFQRSLQR
jgi:Tol biopolymer transport system component